MKRAIILYSCEKFHETGAGTYSKSIIIPPNSTQEELNEAIRKVKEEQKKENEIFRQKRKQEEYEKIIIEKLDKTATAKSLANDNAIETKFPDVMEPTGKPSLILDKGTGNTLFIVGSSKAGKSYALVKVYEEYYEPDKKTIAILFTDSPQSPHYKDLRKKGLVVCPEGGFNDDSKNFITRLKGLQSKFDNPVRFLIMFDDVLNLRYSDIIQKALLIYRNSYISTIISIQYPNLLNKSMRANVNNIFLFRFNSDETIEVAIRAFCGSYEPFLSITSMEQKIKKYKELTMNHQFIYVNPATATLQICRY